MTISSLIAYDTNISQHQYWIDANSEDSLQSSWQSEVDVSSYGVKGCEIFRESNLDMPERASGCVSCD